MSMQPGWASCEGMVSLVGEAPTEMLRGRGCLRGEWLTRDTADPESGTEDSELCAALDVLLDLSTGRCFVQHQQGVHWCLHVAEPARPKAQGAAPPSCGCRSQQGATAGSSQ